MEVTPASIPLLPAFAGAPQVNRVYCLDALALMSHMEPGSVDAVITDPPYNTTNLHFEQPIDWRSFWSECKRVLRTPHSPVILFSQQPFTTDLIVSNRAWFRNEIIWEKSMPVGFLDANRKPLRCHENILVFSERAANYTPIMETIRDTRYDARKQGEAAHYGKHDKHDKWQDNGTRYPRSVAHFAQRHTSFHNTKTLHPTEKPLALMKMLVGMYSQPGALILDPFAGSGSTLRAAQELGRRFIGCDIDPQYTTIAQDRVSLDYTLPMFETLLTEAV